MSCRTRDKFCPYVRSYVCPPPQLVQVAQRLVQADSRLTDRRTGGISPLCSTEHCPPLGLLLCLGTTAYSKGTADLLMPLGDLLDDDQSSNLSTGRLFSFQCIETEVRPGLEDIAIGSFIIGIVICAVPNTRVLR